MLWLQYFAQGYFDLVIGGATAQTTDLPIGGHLVLPSDTCDSSPPNLQPENQNTREAAKFICKSSSICSFVFTGVGQT